MLNRGADKGEKPGNKKPGKIYPAHSKSG